MKTTLTVISLTVLVVTAASAQEVTWSKSIKGLMEKQCAACHGAASAPDYPTFKQEKDAWLAKGQGMRMDTYNHLISFAGWPNTGALMRRLDDGKNSKDGKPGNMYAYLGASEEERQKNLAVFKAWVGNWTLKRLPEMTREELSKITVKH